MSLYILSNYHNLALTSLYGLEPYRLRTLSHISGTYSECAYLESGHKQCIHLSCLYQSTFLVA